MKLSESAEKWVESTLEKMTLEQCVGQLLCPKNDLGYTAETWASIIKDIPVSCVFFTEREDKKLLLDCIAAIHANESIPTVIVADMEQGMGKAFEGMSIFPYQMAIGATGESELAEKVGIALAREARSLGIHWTFSPVIDPSINPDNPSTNVRAFGDIPEQVAEFSVAKIRGLQKGNMLAATAKHFPGDGTDDRDQHLCNTINYCSTERWHKTYGKIWRRAIQAEVQTIMSGHLSLPYYQGFLEHPEDAMPATLSEELQKKLLRDELGFKGVVISDAASMIGFTSRVPVGQSPAVENIRTGSDICLFADAYKDFADILNAANTGILSKEQIRNSARRILHLKAWLGLHEGYKRYALTSADMESHRHLTDEIAVKAATLLKADKNLPAPLNSNSKVLTVDICYGGIGDIETATIDEELRKRGHTVDHLKNPTHYELIEKAANYDRVFVNIQIMQHGIMGTIRMTTKVIMPFWRAFWVKSQNVVFTSFGTPYIMYDIPHVPNMLLMYDNSPSSQKAAVKAWLGEIKATGKCPVKLPKHSDKFLF